MLDAWVSTSKMGKQCGQIGIIEFIVDNEAGINGDRCSVIVNINRGCMPAGFWLAVS